MTKLCPYGRCDGTGLVPLTKDGKVIPFAWVHCDCHPIYGLNPEPEHYHPVSPEDYDFPLSDTYRAWTYEHCNVPDPAASVSHTDMTEIEDRIEQLELMTSQPGQIPQRFQNEIKQLKAQLLYLQKKIYALQDSKPVKKESVTKTQNRLKAIEI